MLKSILFGHLALLFLSSFLGRSTCSSRIFITELLTTEFLIRFPPILSLINELKLSIESSKGIYPISIPSSPIIPSSIVSNDYSTSNQLNKFRRYINIGDPIAVLGPIDLVSGSVDYEFMDFIWISFNFIHSLPFDLIIPVPLFFIDRMGFYQMFNFVVNPASSSSTVVLMIHLNTLDLIDKLLHHKTRFLLVMPIQVTYSTYTPHHLREWHMVFEWAP